MKKIIPVIIGLFVIVGAGYVYMKNKAGTNMEPAPSPVALPATGPSVTDSQQMPEKTFAVEGGMYYFKPNIITVKKGDTVKITMTNKEGFHDFVIDEFNVRTKKIKAGESDTVTFVADKTGSFEYYCSVGNHRAMGMKGTLVVQ